jgi:23S rRNA pseudouridine1911/1915/1917 synthase
LIDGLAARYPELSSIGDPQRPGIVHRLDKGTSGLLVVARSPAAFSSLTTQLKQRTMSRSYLALVEGALEAEGVVDAPVGRSSRVPTRMAVTVRGRPARTRYRVLHQLVVPGGGDAQQVSLIQASLETGRTHQIRVHMAAIGHPVVGDRMYGMAGRASRARPCGGIRRGRPHLGRLHLAGYFFTQPVCRWTIPLLTIGVSPSSRHCRLTCARF